MKALVTTKTIVNFQLQTFLFAFSIIMHGAASFVAATHPLLGLLFAIGETLGWIFLLLSWVTVLLHCVQYWAPKLWIKLWTAVRTHVGIKKAKKGDTFVPVAQLTDVCTTVRMLRLALHGMTPELEHARRTHFQMHGEAVPSLILPPQNALLFAEYESLVKMLNHFGFPFLESVRLQKKDIAFIQQWGSDLEARLRRQQKRSFEQQALLRATLATMAQQHTTLGDTYAFAHSSSGYQRMKGALRLLEQMVNDQRCPSDLAQTSMQKLQSDMHILIKQCEQEIS